MKKLSILTVSIISALYITTVLGQSIEMLATDSGSIPENLIEDLQSGNTTPEALLNSEIGIQNMQATSTSEELLKAEMAQEILTDDKQPEESIKPEKIDILENKDIKINNAYYGYNFFTNRQELNLLENLPSPNEYQVGPGDELIITMWGDTELRQKDIINRDGNVYFEKVGLISLVGLDLEEVKTVLKSRFEKVYSSLKGGKSATTFMEISLGNLKLINIHFLGEVNNPGVMPIHPFSTLTTGLIQAGGVSIEGSLRDIKIIRSGETLTSIDYYQYFKKGNIVNNVRLQNNDVISIPIRESAIKIEGLVKHPSIYEIKTEETLEDLIQYAGGLEFNASEKINIKRVLPIQYRIDNNNIFQNLWVNFSEANEIKLLDGDIVSIPPLIEIEQKVTIEGSVKKPGEYFIFEGMTVINLLDMAGGIFSDDYWETVYPYRADLIRRNIFNLTTSIIPIKLDSLKAGHQNQNYTLKNGDKLIIYPSSINNYQKQVEIIGEVKNPGVYELDQNMGLSDLILRSGGFNFNSYPAEVEINSVDPFDIKPNSLISIRKIKVDSEKFNSFSEIDPYLLKHKDQIIVRKYPDFEFHRNITILGEVKFPGNYSLKEKNESLGDLIDRAGSLTEESFIEGIKISREGKRVILDRKIGDKVDFSVPIFENDTILVPKFYNIVEVIGEVNNPGVIQYKRGLSLLDYIDKAGQINRNGDKKTVSVYYANGESKGRKLFFFYPKIRAGSRIVVYPKPEELPIDRTQLLTDISSTIIQALSLLIMVDRLNN